MSTGLYIGRFQPFHLGHLSAVSQALRQVDRLIIAIGSSQYGREAHNPLTGQERKTLIAEALDEAGLSMRCDLYLLPDIHDSDKWVSYAKKRLPAFDRVFVGDRGLVMELFERDKTPIVSLERELDISASKIRLAIKMNEPWQHYVSEKNGLSLKQIGFESIVRNLN